PRSGFKMETVDGLIEKLRGIDPGAASEAGRVTASMRPRFIANRSTDAETDGLRINVFMDVLKKYLGLSPRFLGIIPDDPEVIAANREMLPFAARNPDSPASVALREIYQKIME
ncbi:MAG: MinD/ParA family protein, partial [Fibrobacterota bacterium]